MTQKVLIVDDDAVDRIAVRRALRAGGFGVEVHEASSCEEAHARLLEGDLDCVFLDFLLPDGNGLAVIQAARAAGVRCPIVVLTGQGDEQTAVELMKAGATDYLPKAQASPERLAHALRNALRVHQAERQALVAERERERALQLERLARDEAETAQRRLAFLAEASAIVSSSLDYEETIENVARLAVPAFADWCFVDLLEEDGAFRRMAIAHDDPGKAGLAERFRRRYPAMPDAPHGVSRVIATGRAEVLQETPDWVLMSLARDAEHLDMMRELRPSSIMTVPLVARGRTIGAMTFLSRGPRRYAEDELAFAEEIARRAALAVENARLFDDARRAEVRLRRQLDVTTAITGSLAEGVCAFDATGRVMFANAAAERILGFDAGTLLARPLSALTRAPATAVELVRAVLGGRVLRMDDDAFVRADGETVPVSFVASPILTEGEVSGGVLAFHDATARKLAEAELENSRRQLAQTEKLSALGTLVSGVAHELRTPLTYLSNNLFLLQTRLEAAAREDPKLDAIASDVRRYSQAALEGVDRINALVRDLRPFASTESGQRVDAGLHTIVATAVDLFRATQRGRVEVIASLAPTGAVRVDRGQLQRVVINLLVNASEAMPKGGRVFVSTRAEDDLAVLEVEDEGGGIPRDVQKRMFDPFFTTKAEGTGLGLAITQRIVEAHGGEIRYETEEGRGTLFRIVLPRAQAALMPASGRALDVPVRSLPAPAGPAPPRRPA